MYQKEHMVKRLAKEVLMAPKVNRGRQVRGGQKDHRDQKGHKDLRDYKGYRGQKDRKGLKALGESKVLKDSMALKDYPDPLVQLEYPVQRDSKDREVLMARKACRVLLGQVELLILRSVR